MPEVKREAILDAALSMFFTKGVDGASMRDIAPGTGLQVSTLYHYFPTKEAMLMAVLDRAGARLATPPSETDLGSLPLSVELLREAFRRHALGHMEFPLEATLFDTARNSLPPAARERLVWWRDRYENWFQDAVHELANGSSSPDLRLRNEVRLSLSAGIGLARWVRPDGPLSLSAIAEDYADFVIRGMRLGRTSD